MSRRRVSVKDLGEADCQGWLQRRKDGRSFLGSKWKRYWFVLKKSSLYWYCNKEAEKAEGFINLTGFIIEEAKACRKKHVITATHPHLVTIFIAADSFADMNKWLSRLCDAAEPNELINAEGSYSEDSDQENDTPEPTCRDLHPEPDQREPEAATEPSSPSCCRDAETQLHSERFPFLSSQAEEAPPPSGSQSSDSRTRTSSEGCNLSRTRTQSSSSSLHLMVDLPAPGEAARNPQLCIPEEAEERPSDEMESLYEGLKAARLSPNGQRDFRASFLRRSHNEKVNEKLHLLRILSSTLKAKELELQLMEQIMKQPDLQAPTYRQWKESNQILLEDILQPSRPAGGAANLSP